MERDEEEISQISVFGCHGNVRPLAHKMDEIGALMKTQQEYQGGNIIKVSPKYGYRNNSNFSLLSYQIIQEDNSRKVTVKKELLQCLTV